VIWDDLKHLEALARLGSAGRAARELGVSQATVYRRIAALEDAVGTPVIHRRRGAGEVLTEAGAALASVARGTKRSLDEATREIRRGSDEVAGTVSLTTVEGFVPLLAEPLAQLARDYPNLSVDVTISHRGPSVVRGQVDVAIAVMKAPPEVLVGKKLMTIEYGAYGTAEAVAQSPNRWLTVGPPMHTTAQAEWEAQHARPVVMTTASRALMLDLVLRGVGVGIFPHVIAARHPTLVEVEALREPLQSLSLPAWLLTHPDLRHTARVSALMAALGVALSLKFES